MNLHPSADDVTATTTDGYALDDWRAKIEANLALLDDLCGWCGQASTSDGLPCPRCGEDLGAGDVKSPEPAGG